jgi:anaerobic ribonucleoside-triphosphate reductase activating protein
MTGLAAPLRLIRDKGTRSLRVGGLSRFSSVDYPGLLAAVVFVPGCPWRCGYCHNPALQKRPLDRQDEPAWAEVLDWLQGRRGLLDAVVFSGGEPTLDPGLPGAIAQVRELGYRVGLHTTGFAPARLQALLAQVDWVGLDIKAPLRAGDDYARITGARRPRAAVQRSLEALVASEVDFECRTTAHPALLDGPALLRIGEDLSAAGVGNWALQIARETGTQAGLGPVAPDYPTPAVISQLQQQFPGWVLRR